MNIGVPKEIKNHEYRVGLVPASVSELIQHGHHVFVQHNAGSGIGYEDEDYLDVGATILPSAEEIFEQSELIIKVKEPQIEECKLLTEKHTLFTYLHLAPDTAQTHELLQSGAACIAYETVTDNSGRLPLLIPMSEVAGRMSIQAGATALQRSNGGSGVLLAGVPGVSPAKIVIIGGGIVGSNAAQMAVGLGADVTILDNNLHTLRKLDNQFNGTLKTLYSSHENIEQKVKQADLVIGAVLVPGAQAPKLVSRELVQKMKKGSAIVDVAIDQGGCIETSRITTHHDPTYVLENVVHYCVGNMPGGVARTAAQALNNATLPYVLTLANKGTVNALKHDKHLLNGLNVYRGKVTQQQVAEAQQLNYVHPLSLL